MFPDNMNEVQVMKFIESVYNNPTRTFTRGGRTFLEGIPSGKNFKVEIEVDGNNAILSGYPLFGS